MPPPPRVLSRRAALRAGGAAVLGGLLTAGATSCGSEFAGLPRLRIGAGGSQGVYYALGNALADAWLPSLDLAERPEVRITAGSVENVALLAKSRADVVFSAADVAEGTLASAPPVGREPRALARIYDDALQVVVFADSPITQLADLRGRRVSIGATDSGVIVMANRVMAAAGLSAASDLTASTLGIDDSLAALRDGRIDAFFWSGALTTGGVTELASHRPIRLLDLNPLIPMLRHEYPVYNIGTVPAGTYETASAVTTLFVRNFLLVPASMPAEVAEALVNGLFAASEQLAKVNPAGRAIDTRSGIGTQPIPLHPGAERYFRSVKVFD